MRFISRFICAFYKVDTGWRFECIRDKSSFMFGVNVFILILCHEKQGKYIVLISHHVWFVYGNLTIIRNGLNITFPIGNVMLVNSSGFLSG